MDNKKKHLKSLRRSLISLQGNKQGNNYTKWVRPSVKAARKHTPLHVFWLVCQMQSSIGFTYLIHSHLFDSVNEDSLSGQESMLLLKPMNILGWNQNVCRRWKRREASDSGLWVTGECQKAQLKQNNNSKDTAVEAEFYRGKTTW